MLYSTVYIHQKTIENIQMLPKIAKSIQKIAVYTQRIFINQAKNFNLNVFTKWIDKNEI